MKTQGIILMYNLDNARGRQIKLLCLKQGIKIKTVSKTQYLEKVGSLAGMKDMPSKDVDYDGEGFGEEMLVMRNFSDRMLENFLKGFRADKIAPVGLKAMLTATNASWNSFELYEELKKEHESFMTQTGGR